MKKIIFGILMATFSLNLTAKCNTGSIGYINRSGFGLSIEGGEVSYGSYDKNITNVPLSINDQVACFKKKSNYELKIESDKAAKKKQTDCFTSQSRF